MAVATVLAMVEEEMGGETVLVLNEDSILVKSNTEAGTWHAVQMWNGSPCSCSCRGFQFRGDCRHVRAIKTHTRQCCEVCDKPTHSKIFGRVVCALCAFAEN